VNNVDNILVYTLYFWCLLILMGWDMMIIHLVIILITKLYF